MGETVVLEREAETRAAAESAEGARLEQYFRARCAELDRAKTPYGRAMNSIGYLRANLWRHYPEERKRALIEPENRAQRAN